ncbi:hypothetical protein M4951_00800 [Blastopirellula sp. J2-11]|uniref:hypothetical protein n=1 Tax=Blastopirellula sp. J2-11 TaxID=2943192 RepID=UPI0021C781CA|nr:hypothetical protein [Blastopirellula sp. J2-11]UUO06866.1 hypothetical protein M4951_00800 [Blastopirellula sp. J2-11]
MSTDQTDADAMNDPPPENRDEQLVIILGLLLFLPTWIAPVSLIYRLCIFAVVVCFYRGGLMLLGRLRLIPVFVMCAVAVTIISAVIRWKLLI